MPIKMFGCIDKKNNKNKSFLIKFEPQHGKTAWKNFLSLFRSCGTNQFEQVCMLTTEFNSSYPRVSSVLNGKLMFF